MVAYARKSTGIPVKNIEHLLESNKNKKCINSHLYRFYFACAVFCFFILALRAQFPYFLRLKFSFDISKFNQEEDEEIEASSAFLD